MESLSLLPGRVVVKNGATADTLKTYYNGSYSFAASKNQIYSVTISIPASLILLL